MHLGVIKTHQSTLSEGLGTPGCRTLTAAHPNLDAILRGVRDYGPVLVFDESFMSPGNALIYGRALAGFILVCAWRF